MYSRLYKRIIELKHALFFLNCEPSDSLGECEDGDALVTIPR